jgi:hypothetical protein
MPNEQGRVGRKLHIAFALSARLLDMKRTVDVGSWCRNRKREGNQLNIEGLQLGSPFDRFSIIRGIARLWGGEFQRLDRLNFLDDGWVFVAWEG